MNPTHLLRVDAVNFGPFFDDTTDLSTRRGGSLLLLDSVESTKRWLREFFGEPPPAADAPPASETSPYWRTVVAAASTGLFEVALSGSQPGDLCGKMENKLRDDPALRHATFTVDLVSLEGGFDKSHEALIALSRQRRLSSLSLAVPEWNTSAHEPCALDKMRPGVVPGNIPEREREKISASVSVRREYGRKQKSKFYQAIATRHQPKNETIRCLKFCTDLHDLAGQPPPGCTHLADKIAVIYLDGNSFGKRIRAAATNAEAYREVSTSIARDRETMLTGLLERMEADAAGWKNKGEGRLETLLWGGDEILWVVPAWKGWETLRYFYDKARHWKIPGAKDTSPLTHSAGLVFAHMKAPIQRLESLARQLAEKAKAATSRSADAFACEVLESYDHTGVSLEAYYQRRYPCWKWKRPGGAESGWLGFDHLALRGENMAAIQQTMHRLEAEDFPHRRLQVNVRAVLDAKNKDHQHTPEAAAAATSDDASYLAKLTSAMPGPVPSVAWLHAAMLWDYVARVPTTHSHHRMISWKITLNLEGPVLTKSTAPGAYGLDAIMARDAKDRPCLPGSLLKGRLRQAWEELGIATDPLGPNPVSGRDAGGSSNEPVRGALHFTDLICGNAPPGGGIRHRVQIEPATGAAKEHALLMAETPFGSGADVLFTGTIEAVTSDPAALEKALHFGLRWITHLGSHRGCGFGRVKGVTLTPVKADPVPCALNFTDGLAGLALTPLAPFCFARHRTAENIFESTDIIPGAAIKGCLAEYWKQSGRTTLPPWFDRLRITHAFPAPADATARPVALPVALVMDEHDVWSDATLCPQAFLFKDGTIPRYAGGWKDSDAVTSLHRAHFGWAEPQRTLRVRTAIDRPSQRAADEHLFAHELIEPGDCVWLCRVDASALTDTEQTEAGTALNAALAHGLRGLGKTKARARVAAAPIADKVSGCHPHADLLVLTLQTPAVLLDPGGLDKAENRTPAALKDRYAAAFREILGPGVTLQHLYATQSLAGGQYLWRRFQGSRPYNPWLLTDPGSVFVFTATNPAALAKQWHGRSLGAPQGAPSVTAASVLTLPSAIREAYDLTGDPAQDWQRCPFLPQNGYGEVAANLACHWTSQPQNIQPLAAL